MQISAVNQYSPSFAAKAGSKKKINKKAVAITALAIGSYAYATNKGKGGIADGISDMLQPIKKQALKFISNCLNGIKK